MIKTDPLLVVDSLVISSEQGLLGVAVDPDFPDSNYVYLFHTMENQTNQVSRFEIGGDVLNPESDQLTIDPASKKKIFSAPDSTRFHNGGTLRFGKDKTLYISLGDDAFANEVQNLTNLYGKIIRIHRDGSVPLDNPSYPDAPEDSRPEIFAMGLRNPFRFSIDPLTQELLIGDVGTDLYEELNISSGGENFGYPHYEGEGFFRDFVSLIPPEPLLPAYYYPYSSRGRSAIALVTYRPSEEAGAMNFPVPYHGAAFFADYFDSRLQYLMKEEGGYARFDFGSDFTQLVDGAVTSDGSLYLLSYRGRLHKISYDLAVSNESEIPRPGIALLPSYPNPARGSTTVQYQLEQGGNTVIEVFDVLGRKIDVLSDQWQAAGSHSIRYETANLSAGVYIIHLQQGEERRSQVINIMSSRQ